MTLRVLHVIPAIADRYGGPSRLVIEMCRALRQRHIDAEIVTTDADGDYRLEVSRTQLVDYRGVPVRFFRRDFSEAFKYSRKLAAWLRRNVAEFDLVHIHAVFSHSSMAAANACRERDTPYIVRPLGTLDPWSMGVKPLRKKLFWWCGVERMLREAAMIQYTTEIERREVEKSLGLSRGVVISNAVDLAALKADLSNQAFSERFPALAKRPYILFLGRLHPKKNLELLIESFASCTTAEEKVASPLLVLAGEGDAGYRRQLESRAAQTPVAGRILFPGWLEGREKNAVLRRAKLFALPSLDENFGISVVEAMACGIPVLVSTGVFLHEEIARATAGWVWDGNPATLSSLLEQALQANNLNELGDQGRNLAKKEFDWAGVVEKLQALYEDIVRND